jgi:hypothetical protein
MKITRIQNLLAAALVDALALMNKPVRTPLIGPVQQPD